jgi:hypothetical protein
MSLHALREAEFVVITLRVMSPRSGVTVFCFALKLPLFERTSRGA